MGERTHDRIPDWAQKERTSDLAWLQENLHIFFPAAQQGFETMGRGALVTDTTTLVKHPKGESHPFFYLPIQAIQEARWHEVLRLVRGYDPSWELVAVLLKQGRESAYRIGVPSAREGQ